MSFKFSDFGITDTDSTICPECNAGAFSVDVAEGKWHCTKCDYAGTLKVEGYERSKETNVFSAGELAPDIVDLYDRGLERGKETGWPELDDIFTVRLGELTICGGIPSHGKSYFCEALGVNVAFLHGWPVAMFSPEHRPHSMHIARFVQKFTGRPFRKGAEDRVTKQMVKDTIDWMNKRFYFLAPPEYTVRSVLAAMSAAVGMGAKFFLIDPWNAIESNRPQHMHVNEYIGRTLNSFRKFAQDHKVAVFIIAHPKKLERDKKTGDYPVPRPYDIAESSLFYSVPDNILAVWRKNDSDDDVIRNTIQVHVQKVKWESVGSVGRRDLRWRPANGTFFSDSQAMEIAEYPWEAVFGPGRKRK